MAEKKKLKSKYFYVDKDGNPQNLGGAGSNTWRDKGTLGGQARALKEKKEKEFAESKKMWAKLKKKSRPISSPLTEKQKEFYRDTQPKKKKK